MGTRGIWLDLPNLNLLTGSIEGRLGLGLSWVPEKHHKGHIWDNQQKWGESITSEWMPSFDRCLCSWEIATRILRGKGMVQKRKQLWRQEGTAPRGQQGKQAAWLSLSIPHMSLSLARTPQKQDLSLTFSHPTFSPKVLLEWELFFPKAGQRKLKPLLPKASHKAWRYYSMLPLPFCVGSRY